MNSSPESRRRANTYIALTSALFLGYYFFRDIPWQGSKQLHTIMEIIATLLASGVGALALIQFYSRKNNTILFIGAAFLGTAFLDGYHAIVTPSFFDIHFPSAPSSLIPWSWIASRVFLSVFLCLSYLAWKREEKLGEGGRISEGSVYWAVSITTIASFVFFAFTPLPTAYVGHESTFFHLHRQKEFIPALFFLIALAGYLKKGLWRTDHFEHWLIMSMIVGLVGQVTFMSTSERLFDFQFNAAHLLKILGYIFVLTGLLINMYHLFRQADKTTQELEISANELTEANKHLEDLALAGENISRHLDLDDVLQSIGEEAFRIFGNQRISIIMYEPDRDDWRFIFSEGLSATYRENLMQRWKLVPGYSTAVNRQAVFIKDARVDSRTKEVYGLIEREGFISIALLPLREAGETLGLLSLYYNVKQEFGLDDQALTRTFSEYVGTALRNALSLHRARRETQRLQALEALNRQITQSLDMDKVLENIICSAAELLGASYGRIHLLSEDGAMLEMCAAFGDIATSPLNESTPIDWGLRGVVIQTKEPLFIPDVKKEEGWEQKRWAEEQNIFAFIAVPILLEDRAIGIITLMGKENAQITNKDIPLIQSLANLGGIAIQNARLFHESEDKGKRLTALLEVTQRLTRGLDLASVLKSISESAASLFDGEAGFRILEGDELVRVAATQGALLTMVTERLQIGESISGRVAETGEPLFTSNLKEDQRSISAHREAAIDETSGSLMCIPVKMGSHVIGTLHIFKEAGHQFRQDDIDLATSLADQAAIAIQNARLFEELTSHTEKLELSEARFRSIINSAQDAIVAIDEAGFITLFNAGAERMFEYAQEDILGKKVNLLMSPPYDIEHDAHIKAYLDTGVKKALGANRTLDARRKSGEIFPIEISIGEVSVGDRKLFTGIIRDITERHEIDRMKNEFISVVSHEIRTPLTSLRGSLGLLSGGVISELNEQGKALIDIAVNNSDRLIRLINDILDLEKIESGKLELQFTSHQIGNLITRAIEEMGGLASGSGIKIETEVEPSLVDADGDAILQVLTNLISNAIKFSEPGSPILISSNFLENETEIHVADRGRGIPPEALESIFDRFQQVDSSDVREKGGTGLGLAICNAIVQQHGGQIWVESEPGNGSIFSFSLPRTAREPAPAPEPTPRLKPTKATILLCEDDRGFVRLLELLLENEGYDFIPTFSAEEALAYLENHKVDAVLLDIHLPGMSGIDLLNKVKKFPDDKRPPVIVMSSDDPVDISDLPAPFLMDWITKPLDEGRLLARLKAALKVGKVANVLVVDDDPDLRAIVTQLLEKKKIQVRTAASGIEAVKQFHDFLPELIILDIMMPGGDGFYVIDSLRIELERRKIPIIVYSSKEPTLAEKKRLSTETTVFLTKSKTSQDHFSHCVVELLNGLL